MANDIVVKNETSAVSTDILSDAAAFENAQRIGKLLTQSQIVPQAYYNNLPNVIVAMEIAARNRLSPIVVMQNLNVIKGRPTWSSKYIIAALTTSRVDNLHYEMASNGTVQVQGFGGKTSIENLACRAIATDKKTGEERIGPWVDMKMAVAEGWYSKDGSKWKTMPEMMIRYRAATFFASVFYPELSIGGDLDDNSSVSAEPVTRPTEVVQSGEMVKPAEEAPAKPKRAKKAEGKKPAEPATEEVPAEEAPVIDADFEDVAEEKPAPVAMPQTDDSEEWDNWGE